jgi:FdhD protein
MVDGPARCGAMTRRRTERVLAAHRTHDGVVQRRPEQVAVEEPMEIRLDGHLVATTMRTPGHDFELAVGWCHSEGLLAGRAPHGVRYCAIASAVETNWNVVTVETDAPSPLPPTPRLTTSTASCGICGSDQIDALAERLSPVEPAEVTLDVLASVPQQVRERQPVFDATGGVHAAAAFDADGRVLVVREDVGRHNAVDAVVGRMLLDGQLPATGLGLFVSGRAGYELVQKAWAAGFGAMVAVGAPTALAVRIAEQARIVLAGFARDGALTVYAQP